METGGEIIVEVGVGGHTKGSQKMCRLIRKPKMFVSLLASLLTSFFYFFARLFTPFCFVLFFSFYP
jgi:hypothetical protein